MTFSQRSKTQQVWPAARRACHRFLTSWYASAALRSYPSPQSADARPASEASLPSPATCALRVAKRPSCRNGKLVLAWFQVADLWPDYPGSWAEEGRWKCCSAQTIFEAIWPSFMATSIALYPTRSSTLLSTRWRCAFLRSTNRPSLKRKRLSMLRACRPTKKLPPSGTHVLPLFSAPPAKRESANCWSVASTSRATLKIGSDTTWASSAAEVPSKLYARCFKHRTSMKRGFDQTRDVVNRLKHHVGGLGCRGPEYLAQRSRRSMAHHYSGPDFGFPRGDA